MQKRLYKSENDKKLFGVCGGIAEYLNIDSTVVRMAWVILTLFCGTGLIIYFICAFIFPDKSEVDNTRDSEKMNQTLI